MQVSTSRARARQTNAHTSSARSFMLSTWVCVVGASLTAATASAQTDSEATPPPSGDAPASTTESAPPATEAPAAASSASSDGGSSGGGNAGGDSVGGDGAGDTRTGFSLSDDGRSRLHLGIDASAGLDTNPYIQPSSVGGFAGDAVVRLRPNAWIDIPGRNLAFRGDAFFDYGFLPGLFNPSTQNVLLYNSSIGGNLEINRGSPLSFAVGDHLAWNSDPGQVVLGTLFNRLWNQFRAGAGFKPGGGTLQFRLAYNFDFIKWFDVVEDSNVSIANGTFDSMTHTLSFRTDYRFLPRTGVFFQLNTGWNSFYLSAVNPQSFPLTAMVGFQGQILPRLGVLASVGYTNPLVVDNPLGGGSVTIVTGQIMGAVGQLEAQWAPTNTSKFAAGLQRTISPTPLYQFQIVNRLYASYSHLFFNKVTLNLGAGGTVQELGTEQNLGGGAFLTDKNNGDRLDGHVDGDASISYHFTNWLSLGLSNNLDWHLTNANDATNGSVNLSYVRNLTMLMLSIKY